MENYRTGLNLEDVIEAIKLLSGTGLSQGVNITEMPFIYDAKAKKSVEADMPENVKNILDSISEERKEENKMRDKERNEILDEIYKLSKINSEKRIEEYHNQQTREITKKYFDYLRNNLLKDFHKKDVQITPLKLRTKNFDIDKKEMNGMFPPYDESKQRVIRVDTSSEYNKYISQCNGETTMLIGEDEFKILNLDIFKPLIEVNGTKISDIVNCNKAKIRKLFKDETLLDKIFDFGPLSKDITRIVDESEYNFDNYYQGSRVECIKFDEDINTSTFKFGDIHLHVHYSNFTGRLRLTSVADDNGRLLKPSDAANIITTISKNDINKIKTITKNNVCGVMEMNNTNVKDLKVNVKSQDNNGMTTLSIGRDEFKFLNLDIFHPVIEVNGQVPLNGEITHLINNKKLARAIDTLTVPEEMVIKMEEEINKTVFKFKSKGTLTNPMEVSVEDDGRNIFTIDGYDLTTILDINDKVMVVAITKDGKIVNEINEVLNLMLGLSIEQINTIKKFMLENKEAEEEVVEEHPLAVDDVAIKFGLNYEMIDFLIENITSLNLVSLFEDKFNLIFSLDTGLFEGVYNDEKYSIRFNTNLIAAILELKFNKEIVNKDDEEDEGIDLVEVTTDHPDDIIIDSLPRFEEYAKENLDYSSLKLPVSNITVNIGKEKNIVSCVINSRDENGNATKPYTVNDKEGINNIINSLTTDDVRVLRAVLNNDDFIEAENTINSGTKEMVSEFIEEETNKKRKPITMHDKSFKRLLEGCGFDDIKSLYMITVFYIRHISDVYDYEEEFDFAKCKFTNDDVKMDAIQENYGFSQGEEALEPGMEYMLNYHGLMKLLCKLDSRVLDYPELSLEDFIYSI